MSTGNQTTVEKTTKKKRSLKHWLKEIAIYFVVIVAVSMAVDAWRMSEMPTKVAPRLEGLTLSGEYLDAIEMSYSKPVIVYFWATWCGACKFVSPTINSVGDSYHVVGIAGSSGEDKRVSRFMAAHDYHFNNINDNRSEIFRQWGVSVTPTIVILHQGQIKSVTTGITTPPGLYARLWLENF
ncbi:protein disulfide oxidoreductase [Vibrio sp. ZSDE26]|uniref:Protein disulfide oxidoreductase n=1 Tax=Vibrio amylolyticus TaxID=2847292 RepID=A0A9X2BHU9_9VIBR|nr:protein disulfide oxidoreductase [Vibrio amylolyticus]MCK6263405.1 protein disulfide oxidoreductase [Vibrio amylolyticus]